MSVKRESSFAVSGGCYRKRRQCHVLTAYIPHMCCRSYVFDAHACFNLISTKRMLSPHLKHHCLHVIRILIEWMTCDGRVLRDLITVTGHPVDIIQATP